MRNQALFYSGSMHLALLLIVLLGLPEFFDTLEESEPVVISIDILPISELTNVKPSDKARREKHAKKPKKVKKPTPAPTETKKVEPKKDNPVKIPVEKKPAKEKEKKPEKQKKKEKPKLDEQQEDILKNLKKEAQTEDEPKKKKKKPKDKTSSKSSAKSKKAYNNAAPLSLSEKDAVLSQFYRHWRLPAGSSGDYDLVVVLNVKVDKTGRVTKVDLPRKYKRKYNAGGPYRAAVDSAVRALWKTSPITRLPADKYETWKDMELTFNPRDALY